jgi:hypothetical protein
MGMFKTLTGLLTTMNDEVLFLDVKKNLFEVNAFTPS